MCLQLHKLPNISGGWTLQLKHFKEIYDIHALASSIVTWNNMQQCNIMQYQLVNIYECFPDIVSFGLFGYLFLQSYIILLINSMFRLNFHGSLKTTHFPFMALAAILGLVPWEPSNGNPSPQRFVIDLAGSSMVAASASPPIPWHL